jgi:hypothetical protein
VLRAYKPGISGKNTIFDDAALSPRACQLWRSPSGAKMAAHFHRPAGVCRRLGVISLEFALTGKPNKTKTEDTIYSLLKSSRSSQVEHLSSRPKVSLTKTDYRKDAVAIYGKDYHKVNENVTQLSLMNQFEKDWIPVVSAGHIVPQWNTHGEIVASSAQTTCKRLLQLLKDGKLEDLQSGRESVLYHGLKHIPTDAKSVLAAIVDLSKPSKDLYRMPLLVSTPKIRSIERLNSFTTTVHVSIGVYASRLLFEVSRPISVVVADDVSSNLND